MDPQPPASKSDPPSPVPQTSPTAPAAPATSLTARLFNVFATPGEVFHEVKSAPSSTANWLAPALLLIVVGWLSAWLIFSQDSIKQQLSDISQQSVQKQIDRLHMSAEQAERSRGMAEKFGSIGYKVGAVVVPVLAGFASPFWGGLILWLVGAKVFKGNFPYLKAVEVAGLANMIGVLEAVVKTLLIVGLGNLFASPSLALLVKPFDPQNPVHSALAAVNIMTFWLLAVRALGLARLSGVSFGRAAAWVFGIWAVFTGLLIGLGAAVQAIFAR